MKRVRIALIIMAAVLVAAAAVFIIADHIKKGNEQQEQAEENELSIFAFGEKDIESMDIENSGGIYTAVFSSDSGWTLKNCGDFTVNDSALSSAASNICNLRAAQILDSKEKSKFGFDDAVKLTVHTGKDDHILYVGDPNPTKEYYYVMKDGSDSIYLIDYITGQTLDLEKNSLKSPYPYGFSALDVTSFTLWKGSDTDDNVLFSMEKDSDGNWSMLKPFSGSKVNATGITQYLTSVSNDTLKDFDEENIPESSYGKYGFDKPEFVFEISTDSDSQRVIFGKDTEDGTQTYALLDKYKQVVRFDKNTVTAIGSSTIDMIDSSVYSPDISEIKSMDITVGGNEVMIEVDDSGYSVDGRKAKDISGKSQSACIDLFNSFNSLSGGAVERNSTPQGDEYLTIDYKLNDGTTKTISYIKTDKGNGYYAMRDGEYSGLIVAAENVENVDKAYKALAEEIN